MTDQTYYNGKPVTYSAETIAQATRDAVESAKDHIRKIKANGGTAHLVGRPYLYQTGQGSNILQGYTYKEARQRSPREVVAAALIHYRATPEEEAQYNRQVACKVQKITEHLWYCEGHHKNNVTEPRKHCGAIGL